MRGPFELIGYLYDYHYNYVRYYVHRRFLFSDYSWDQFYKDVRFNVFRNKDYDNVGQLLKQTTLYGFAGGVGIAPIKFAVLRDINKWPVKKALPVAIGIVLIGTGVGLTYGTVVNATARMRDNKDGAVNHAIAALVAFPVLGIYAKKNKLQWGIYNAVLLAGLVSLIKLACTGNFIKGQQLDELPKPYQPHISPIHWKP